MDILFYIAASATFIMVIHFGLAIKGQFNLFQVGAIFTVAGVVAWYTGGHYDWAFIVSVVLSLMFW